jgi:O-antigen/teichoic acid export membrane protein
MLVRQTLAYLTANVVSALFGFVNVFVFTHAFSVEAFGTYLLGLGFATVFSTLLGSAIKLAILRDQSRNDGTDVRGVALAGLVLCLIAAPFAFGAARLAGLKTATALASATMAMAIVVFESGQELLRAEQKTSQFMRGTLARAILVSLLGAGCALFARDGAQLLFSSSLAFMLAALMVWRSAWGGAVPQFDWERLKRVAKDGLPLALSLTLLAVSGVADRFLIANLIGAKAAGQFGASLDLVRQSLIIPAISIASAFVPIAVRLLAKAGPQAARAHLGDCVELLLAITLPACVGFAVVSPEIADLVLGPDFRVTARQAMPVLAIAVALQIVTQQYLHNSFLLSNRNIFYFANTGSMLLFNVVLAFILIPRYGVMGAVWGRLAAETYGLVSAWALSLLAFRVPLPVRGIAKIAAAVASMAVPVAWLETSVRDLGPGALVVLVTTGVGAYGAACWLLDVADIRRLVRETAHGLRTRVPRLSGASAGVAGRDRSWLRSIGD